MASMKWHTLITLVITMELYIDTLALVDLNYINERLIPTKYFETSTVVRL